MQFFRPADRKMGIAGIAMEFRARREYDSAREEAVEVKIVGLEGEMAVPVILLTTWGTRLCSGGLDCGGPLGFYAESREATVRKQTLFL